MKYKSLFDVWQKSCSESSSYIFSSDNAGEYVITYEAAFKQMCFLSAFFKKNGLKEGEHAALFALNRPDWLILEQAVISLGAVCVSKSPDIGLEELLYIYSNSSSSILITDNARSAEYISENIPQKINFILYIGKDSCVCRSKVFCLNEVLSEFDETAPALIPAASEKETDVNHPVYITYTSGTSAEPKGAVQSEAGIIYVIEELQKINKIKSGSSFVVTFPLSSTGGKSFNLLCFSEGCRLIYTSYKEFFETVKKFQPDYLHLAPKIIQTMYLRFMQEVKNRGAFFEKLFKFSYAVSEKLLFSERKMPFLSGIIRSFNAVSDKLIYKKIRNTLLKDDITIFIGSAHLAEPLEKFLLIMNINYVQHYGLTETAGIAVSNTLESSRQHPCTAGRPLNGTILKIINPETGEEVKRGETGLITLSGPEVMSSYYKNEKASKKALLKDGFLNTGDLGFVDKDGYLTVLSRFDDVIVLSNGYNVYTPLIENELKDSEYIMQAAIAGHGRPYLVSLIVLNLEKYAEWQQRNLNRHAEFVSAAVRDKINIPKTVMLNLFQHLYRIKLYTDFSAEKTLQTLSPSLSKGEGEQLKTICSQVQGSGLLQIHGGINQGKNPNQDETFKEFLINHLNEKIKRKKNYRYYEKIKKVYFLTEGFTIENGMLTNTMKIKYGSVINKYKDIIESLYKDG